jgi:hypothetical protein
LVARYKSGYSIKQGAVKTINKGGDNMTWYTIYRTERSLKNYCLFDGNSTKAAIMDSSIR